MSLDQSLEKAEKNRAARQANGRQSQGPVASEGKAHSAAAHLRGAYYSTTRAEVLLSRGENPDEYLPVMESMLEDAHSAEGLEKQFAGWSKPCGGCAAPNACRRVWPGGAFKARSSGKGCECQAARCKRLTTWNPLSAFRKRYRAGATAPRPEETQAFVESLKGDSSEKTQEFILLLKSLQEPIVILRSA
jgi:hypothetical protein